LGRGFAGKQRAATPGAIRTLRGHHRGLVALAFSPDGQLLASAAQDGVKLWQFPKRREQAMLVGSAQPIGFTGDSKKLITLAADERIKCGTPPAANL